MLESQDYRIVNKFRSAKDYIDFYKKVGIKDFIEVLKNSGKLINPYDSKWKFEDIYVQISAYINEHNKEDFILWKKVTEEAKCINELYKNIYNLGDYKNAEAVEKEYSVSSFLIILEMFLYYLINEIDGNNEANQKLGINFDIKYVFEKKLTPIQKYLMVYDHSVAVADEVLKYLLFYKAKDIMHEYIVTDEYLQASYGHLKVADQKSVLEKIDQEWRFLGRSIIKHNEVFYSECTSVKSKDFFIINSRIENRKNKILNDLLIGQDVSNIIDTEDGISYDEKMAKLYLKEIFTIDNFNYICIVNKRNGNLYKIPLYVLIRAYAILKMKVDEFCDKKQAFTQDLRDVCLIYKEDELKKIFKNNEIENQYVDNLLKVLTLETYKDFYDTPLIPFNGDYLMIPSAVKKIDIAQVVLSCVNQFNFRGQVFENSIINCLNKAGITAFSKSQIDETGEYQCDVLFAIGNTLFICECKAWGEPKSIHSYYEYIEKCIRAKSQLDRISNHYWTNKDELQMQLKIKNKISRVQKIIVLANAVGIDNVIGDTYVTDYSMLSKFLKREKPYISIYADKRIYKYSLPCFSEYEGSITANKLMRSIRSAGVVQLELKNMESDIRKMNINGLQICYDSIMNKVNYSAFPDQEYDDYLARLKSVFGLSCK